MRDLQYLSLVSANLTNSANKVLHAVIIHALTSNQLVANANLISSACNLKMAVVKVYALN